jgi:hypothetical protein
MLETARHLSLLTTIETPATVLNAVAISLTCRAPTVMLVDVTRVAVFRLLFSFFSAVFVARVL